MARNERRRGMPVGDGATESGSGSCTRRSLARSMAVAAALTMSAELSPGEAAEITSSRMRCACRPTGSLRRPSLPRPAMLLTCAAARVRHDTHPVPKVSIVRTAACLGERRREHHGELRAVCAESAVQVHLHGGTACRGSVYRMIARGGQPAWPRAIERSGGLCPPIHPSQEIRHASGSKNH